MINAGLTNDMFFTVAGHRLTVVATDARYTKSFAADYTSWWHRGRPWTRSLTPTTAALRPVPVLHGGENIHVRHRRPPQNTIAVPKAGWAAIRFRAENPGE
jgi:hypothetical protein